MPVDPAELILASVEAMPEPPDSNESVCDRYESQAKGICNAYCEAQNCAGNNDKQSCESLRKNFEKATGERRLPCNPSRCPCWDNLQEEFFYGSLPIVHSEFSRNVPESSQNFEVSSSKMKVRAFFGSSSPGPYTCQVFDNELRYWPVYDYFADTEAWLQCVYDIVTLA